MTLSNSPVLEVIDPRSLKEVLRSPGPCITIVLPPYHPGEPAKPVAALLKADLHRAAEQLARLHFPEAASRRLLEPLDRLAEDPAFLLGSHRGRAIFRAADFSGQLHLMQPAKAAFTVGGCFAIRPLLAEFWTPRLFYILGVSKESVRLFKFDRQRTEAVSLPAGVPGTLAEALELEPPDHDLENRSSIGSTTGSMHAVRFGTGSEREKAAAHLSDFYKLVDRGINRLLGESGVPLVLAGVEQETAAFRAVSAYPNLVKASLPGSPNFSSQNPEVFSRAFSIVRRDVQQSEANALKEALERTVPARVSTDVDVILRAAFEGRVHKLYMDESAARSDVLDRGAYHSWGREDLFNVAAVQAVLHGGDAIELPRDLMPGKTEAAAIMRF